MVRVRFEALSALLLLTSGCPGTLADPESFDESLLVEAEATSLAECGDVEGTIIRRQCGTAGCHADVAPIAGLDLYSPSPLARLVDKQSTRGGALVVRGKPDESILYQKLTARPPYGDRMPSAKAPVDERTLSCVRFWIAEAQ